MSRNGSRLLKRTRGGFFNGCQIFVSVCDCSQLIGDDLPDVRYTVSEDLVKKIGTGSVQSAFDSLKRVSECLHILGNFCILVSVVSCELIVKM